MKIGNNGLTPYKPKLMPRANSPIFLFVGSDVSYASTGCVSSGPLRPLKLWDRQV